MERTEHGGCFKQHDKVNLFSFQISKGLYLASGSFQKMSRRLVRKIRSISNTPTEIKIKSATSNDSFGPTTQELNQLALLTQDRRGLGDICTILHKRLNDNSRNWRHVLKSLTVVQYLLLTGSNEFVQWMKKNAYLVSTLQEFELKGNADIANQIRGKAKTIAIVLKDAQLMEDKRAKFHVFRSNMARPSVDGRSSLDISRADIDLQQLDDPFSTDFQRRTHSFEMRRSLDLDSKQRGIRNQDDVLQSLGNIAEE